MNGNNSDIITLLTSQAFSSLASSRNIKIAEFDAIIAILIKAKIPFDVEYSPGNRREAESAELIIFINPITTLNVTFTFQGGTSPFIGAQQ
jgi:hypothetical protein